MKRGKSLRWNGLLTHRWQKKCNIYIFSERHYKRWMCFLATGRQQWKAVKPYSANNVNKCGKKNDTNIYIKYFSVQISPSKHHSMWHAEMQKNKQKKQQEYFSRFLLSVAEYLSSLEKSEVFLWPSCTFFFLIYFLFWLVRRRSIYSTTSRSVATRQLHPTHTHTHSGQFWGEQTLEMQINCKQCFCLRVFNRYHIVCLTNAQLSEFLALTTCPFQYCTFNVIV